MILTISDEESPLLKPLNTKVLAYEQFIHSIRNHLKHMEQESKSYPEFFERNQVLEATARVLLRRTKRGRSEENCTQK